MALASDLELPVFDYTDPALRGERFHAAMVEVRAESWLASGPFGFIVLDREAGEFFLRSRSAIFPGVRMADMFGVPEGPLRRQVVHNLINVNGADHRRLRHLVNPAFTPRAVQAYRPAMRRYLDELLARADPQGCDVVEALAKPYPSQVIATVMGAPLGDAPRLHGWSTAIQRQFDAAAMLEASAEIERATLEFHAYAEALLQARRRNPGEDLISSLIAAESEGQRLSDVECINLVTNVLVGGVDTTQSQLAHALRLFAEHPKQWERLAADPTLAGAAVEEVLRFEPITPFTARILLEEITHRGVTFPQDTIVMVCAFTANRDESTPAPDALRFDIGAEHDGRVLTFGAGAHYCLGANLARAELTEALAFLAPRMSDLALVGEPTYESILGIYGLAKLPVRWRPAG